MAPHGHIKEPMRVHMRPIWVHMGPYGSRMGPIWVPYGPRRVHMGRIWDPYGIHMGFIWHPYGTIWTHMDPTWLPYGPIWTHMHPIIRHVLKKCRNCERGAPIQGGNEFVMGALRAHMGRMWDPYKNIRVPHGFMWAPYGPI